MLSICKTELLGIYTGYVVLKLRITRRLTQYVRYPNLEALRNKKPQPYKIEIWKDNL